MYFVFGMMVAPFVAAFYRSDVSFLVIPPLSTILPVQVLRSSLFLLASAPFLVSGLVPARHLSSRSVSSTAISSVSARSLGCPRPSVSHSLEITADSFVYAAALVFLLVPCHRETIAPIPAQVVLMFPS
jgi:hypothetical protein